MKNKPKPKWLRSDTKRKTYDRYLQEHRDIAVEGKAQPVDPNQKRTQNEAQFCNYCRTNGHTPSWSRKKIRDEELKGIENEKTAERKVTFTQDYKKKLGPGNGSEQWTRGEVLERRNQNRPNNGTTRNSRTAYQNLFPD